MKLKPLALPELDSTSPQKKVLEIRPKLNPKITNRSEPLPTEVPKETPTGRISTIPEFQM